VGSPFFPRQKISGIGLSFGETAMAKVMYPFSPEELARRGRTETESKRKSWVWRGFFAYSRPMPRSEVKLRAESARTWLEFTLREPMPAREVLRLAKLEGLSEWGVRRAKKHLRIKAVKVGGRRQGWASTWFWTAATTER